MRVGLWQFATGWDSFEKSAKSVPSTVVDAPSGTADTRPLPQAVLTYGYTHLQTAIMSRRLV